MDRLETVLRRWSGSWPAAFLVATVLCGATIDQPTRARMLLAGLAGVWTLLALLIDQRRRLPLERGFAIVATLLLWVALVLTGQGQIASDRDIARWEEISIAALDAAEPAAVEALEALRRAAEDRAFAALEPGADLDQLALPVPFAGTTLECGVSVWRDAEILDWAGAVPGPDRPGRAGAPLVVDHGFRRVLTLRVDDADGRSAYCDVALGILGGLLPDTGVRHGPGEPLSDLLGVEAEVWPRAPLVAGDPATVRIVGVGGSAPWAWVELSQPVPRIMRGDALVAASARASGLLLLAMIPALLLLLQDWPDRWPTVAGAEGWSRCSSHS